MDEEQQKSRFGARPQSDDALKHWRAWGSWYSWGSATGFSIALLSVGGFVWLLHVSGLVL